MSGVRVTKQYIEFKDNTKLTGIFPKIGTIILWPGDINNIPDGYLLCDGRMIDKEETISENSNEKNMINYLRN